MLVADQKHGFRCADNSLSLTLIRSSFDPDPHPELGMHRFSFAVSPVDCSSNRRLVEISQDRAHPLVFLSVEDGMVAVSAVKMAEDDDGGCLVARLYETEGKKTAAALKFFCSPKSAWLADLNENRLKDAAPATIVGETVTVEVEANTVVTLVAQFGGCRE